MVEAIQGCKTTDFGITNINNCQGLKGDIFPSLLDFWPITLFYFGDDIPNVEANIDPKKDGYWNKWVERMFGHGHQIFSIFHSKFPLSNCTTYKCRVQHLIHHKSGKWCLRSKDWCMLYTAIAIWKDAILLDVPLPNYVVCINHTIQE